MSDLYFYTFLPTPEGSLVLINLLVRLTHTFLKRSSGPLTFGIQRDFVTSSVTFTRLSPRTSVPYFYFRPSSLHLFYRFSTDLLTLRSISLSPSFLLTPPSCSSFSLRGYLENREPSCIRTRKKIHDNITGFRIYSLLIWLFSLRTTVQWWSLQKVKIFHRWCKERNGRGELGKVGTGRLRRNGNE